MPTTIIYGERPAAAPGASVEGGDLWLSLEELRQAAGRGPGGAGGVERCLPIPADRKREFLRDGGQRFNLAALARLRGEPLVRDERREGWLFGEGAGSRCDAPRSRRG